MRVTPSPSSGESNPTAVLIASAVAAAAALAIAVILRRVGVSTPAALIAGGGLAVLAGVAFTHARPHVPSDLALAVLAPVALYIVLLIALVFAYAALGGFVSD
jgi:hypothetical protein